MDPEERPLARVFRTLRWAGVAPYESLYPPVVSNKFALYGQLMCFIFGVLYLSAKIIDAVQRRMYAQTLARILSLYLMGSLAIACTIATAYVGMFQAPKRMRNIFRYLESLKKIRKRIGSVRQPDDALSDVSVLYTGTQIFLIALNLYDTVLWGGYKKDYVNITYILTLMNSGYFMANVVLMPCVTVAMTIRLSFRTINERLEELLSYVQSLVKYKKANKKECDVNFRRYGATDLMIQVATINNAIDKLGIIDVQDDGKFELPHEKLRSLTRAYVRTCEVVRQQNNDEKFLLATILVNIVINLTATVFYIMDGLEETDSNFISIAASMVMWIVMDVCRGMLLVSPSHAINTELERSRMLLCKLMNAVQCPSDPLLTELELFLLQLTLNRPAYVALGMFPLTRPLVISMMAICSTYQVVTQGLSY